MKLLIKTMAELSNFASFSGDFDISTLGPALRSAQEFVSRYVGTELLDSITEGDMLSGDQQTLGEYLSVPIANLALLKFANAGNVRLTDYGAMRTKTADANDAFEWQLERVVQSLKAEAFDGIEALLRYLESKLSVFPLYANSAVYKQEKSRLIQSAGVFSKYYDISESRLVLQTLQASMRTAEGSIRKLLGDKLPALLGADLNEDQAAQLDAARRALVYLTIARALREKLVKISDTGVQVCGISNFGTINYKQPATDRQLETSILYFDQQATGFVSDLITLITPAPVTPVLDTGSRVIGTKIVAF